MDGYDQGFRGRAGFGRGIDRNSYDYQYGANPEAYRPTGRGGYGQSFVGDEVGSNAGEFGQAGGTQLRCVAGVPVAALRAKPQQQ